MTNTKCQIPNARYRNQLTFGINQVITFLTTTPLTSLTHNRALLMVFGLETGDSRKYHCHCHRHLHYHSQKGFLLLGNM